MSLPPVLYYFFKHPLPYARTLALQEKIHELQLSKRSTDAASHKDVFLLLQHRPVYTAGRRQTEESVHGERTRLNSIGADFVTTLRGGQLTYHGPGQIVGYPLIDLGRYTPAMGIRDYICRMQKALKMHLMEHHGISTQSSEHTGLFLDAHTKIASIGVQVRHRLTSHGFSMNITREPRAWFDQVIACGLDDVHAGSVESVLDRSVRLEDEISSLVSCFERHLERYLLPMVPQDEGELGDAIMALEEEARQASNWPKAPLL
ncbi:lipoyltransferase [Fistulina hepatica ATCC 64428]|uniref:Octanoyltransferase n=1 Tax=Fistulina hepatica ATCC 64428 TaxID=1128425 RepID=A0A0D7AH55_9AGAR|nr:lipoyltransferase [Fistulina hepatica ATCC 64428]